MKRRIAIVLMTLVILFCIAEAFGLYFARQNHLRESAASTKNQLISDLGTISSALQSGNQALYDKSYHNFTAHLVAYRSNSYARQTAGEQINRLGDYAQLLADDSATIQALNNFHAALLQINLTPDTNDDLEVLADYRKKFNQLALNLESTDAIPALKDLQAETEKLVPKLASQLDAVMVCAGLCPTETMNEKQRAFSETLHAGIKQLKAENAELVERYAPSEYILLLQ